VLRPMLKWSRLSTKTFRFTGNGSVLSTDWSTPTSARRSPGYLLKQGYQQGGFVRQGDLLFHLTWRPMPTTRLSRFSLSSRTVSPRVEDARICQFRYPSNRFRSPSMRCIEGKRRQDCPNCLRLMM
jgi:hypothetical protein